MKKNDYPLLCYKIHSTCFVGYIPEEEEDFIEKDIKSLKQAVISYLQKEQTGPLLEENKEPWLGAKLKRYELRLQSVQEDEDGRAHPLMQTSKLPVWVLLGQEQDKNFRCYVPLLGIDFYYQDAKSLPKLLQYFVNKYFSSRPLKELYRYLRYPPPQLERIAVKAKKKQTWGYQFDFFDSEEPRLLEQLAERYPNKDKKQKMLRFPEHVWERDELVKQVLELISEHRHNVLLVGEPLVGKSAILKQALRKMSSQDKDASLDVWQIQAQRIVSRSKYLGEWQEALETLIYELDHEQELLWVEDIQQLVQIGGAGADDSLAAFLCPFLADGELQIVGELSPSELDRLRRLLPGFIEQFQILEIPVLSARQNQVILRRLAEYSLKQFQIEIRADALELSRQLLERYIGYEAFPGKSLHFLQSCINEAYSRKVKSIDKELVSDVFSQKTGLPKLFLRDDILLDEDALRHFFQERIIGQDHILDVLIQLVKVFKAALNDPKKPIATLLFAGPTGVGKTASAKALADYFFGMGQKKSPLVRLDMSEFQHPAQIARLIGGDEQVSTLIKDIRERPFSVLLLDEIEKADPSIFDALLAVLDEGVLVDRFGRKTYFRNCVIILTSNLGAEQRQSLGFGAGEEPNYEAAVKRFFRPEFVNRLDYILRFKNLEKEAIRQIARKELAEISQREGFIKRRIQAHFSEALLEKIIEEGFDIRYGARPLQRSIEKIIIAPFAQKLLEQELSNCKLLFDYQSQEGLLFQLLENEAEENN